MESKQGKRSIQTGDRPLGDAVITIDYQGTHLQGGISLNPPVITRKTPMT